MQHWKSTLSDIPAYMYMLRQHINIVQSYLQLV